MTLEFGVFEPLGDAPPNAAAFEEHIADAVICERLGYQYFFFIEHQNARFPVVTSPAVYLAALAAATKSLRVGAMVFQLPMHQPIRLAQDTAMVDQLSRGRLEFALGYGTRVFEFAPWYLDFEKRRELGYEVMACVYLETAKSCDFWIDEGLAIVGSPETVVRWIREQQQRCGYDILLAQHQITSMPSELSRRSMRLFGESVIPQFRVSLATG